LTTHRFSEAVQRTIARAQQIATIAGEAELSPAHLLLAISEDGACSGAQALIHLGVHLEVLRFEINGQIPPVPSDCVTPLQASLASTQAINEAAYIARTMGDGRIQTIHILMGIHSQVNAPSFTPGIVPSSSIIPTARDILMSMGVTRHRLWAAASDYHRGYGPLYGVVIE